MTTYVLIPGAGSDAWYWHLVEAELRRDGHSTIAVDLPCDDDRAGLAEYADAVVDAIACGEADDELILVAQSMGGLTAPLVCERVDVDLMVLVAAMVPVPGESPGAWWSNTGHAEALHAAAANGGWEVDEENPDALFLHDVPAALAEESAAHVTAQSGTPFELPWPLAAWPDVPTRFLLCTEDRFFPAAFQRRVVWDRLGIRPDEMPGGHLPALARPVELAARLEQYRQDLAEPAPDRSTRG